MRIVNNTNNYQTSFASINFSNIPENMHIKKTIIDVFSKSPQYKKLEKLGGDLDFRKVPNSLKISLKTPSNEEYLDSIIINAKQKQTLKPFKNTKEFLEAYGEKINDALSKAISILS